MLRVRHEIYTALFAARRLTSPSLLSYNDTINFLSSSTSPLGPYGLPGIAFSTAIPGQQSSIWTYYDAQGGPQLMYWSDQWQSSPTGEKGGDFSYLTPLLWASDGITPLPLPNLATIPITVGPGPG